MLNRRASFRSAGKEVATCDVEFITNRRQIEWGALWAASLWGCVTGGAITEVFESMVADDVMEAIEGVAPLVIDSRYVQVYMPPLRRDGTLVFTEDSEVAVQCAAVRKAAIDHLLPVMRRFYVGDAALVDDVLAWDGRGFAYPGTTIAAVAVVTGDPGILDNVWKMRRVRSFPDARGEAGRRIEQWARSRIEQSGVEK